MYILISSVQNCSGGSSQLNKKRKRNKRCPDRKGSNKTVFVIVYAANLIVYMKSY